MRTIGWDIGGANIKAARVEEGRVVAATQRVCTPHLGLVHLEQAIRDTLAVVGAGGRHAVTMTAELSDAFENRERGVLSIAAICAREIGAETVFYAGEKGFLPKAGVEAAASEIASANWRASAELVARARPLALFVDMGSTTTDIIPIRGGAVAARGTDDAGRLVNGELVYAGLLRGSPATGLPLAPVGGRWSALVDEQFATWADVHRILGEIPSDADTAATVDGRAKTPEASRVRLARLVGENASARPPEAWDALARFFARAQIRRIEDAVALIESRAPEMAGAPIVGAGVGRALLARWARREARAYADFDEFIPAAAEAKTAASDCAPACAVALLASGTRKFAEIS
ncbi:MAG: hydantoinase/oxoprolinase family protein [Methylocystis sp.]